MNNDFIKDDTDLTLLDRTNFQTISPKATNVETEFTKDVETELEKDTVGLSRNPWVRIAIAVGFGSFVLGFGYILSLGGDNKVANAPVKNEEEEGLTLELEEPTSDFTNSEDPNIDMMRSEIALLEQQVALQTIERDPNAASNARTGHPQTRPSETTASRPSTRTTESNRATPVSTPSRPSAAAVVTQPARPITRTVTAAPAPISRPVPTTAPSAPSFSGSNSRPEPVDPQQAWLMASTAGVGRLMSVLMSQKKQRSRPMNLRLLTTLRALKMK
jgi:hypothetical protein